MQSIIQVLCPGMLTLALNMQKSTDGEVWYRFINQTVNLYDSVYLRETRSYESGISILPDDKITSEQKDKIKELIHFFADYNKIKIKGLVIKIDEQIMPGLYQESSQLAGILIGLNYYYQTNLLTEQLLEIATKIDITMVCFLLGGYVSFNTHKKEVTKLFGNPYTNYLIIDPKISSQEKRLDLEFTNFALKSIKESLITNDFIANMPDSYKQIKEFLDKYPNLNHSLCGFGPLYFLACKDTYGNMNVPISLKKEFPKIKIYPCKNVTQHRIIQYRK